MALIDLFELNWCFWVVLGKTLENFLDYKESKPVNPKGNQPWIFIGRTDAKIEAPILWPPDAKGQFTRKHPILGALEILQQCENFFCIIILQFLSHLLSSSMVGLTAMSSKRTYTTHLTSQVCCSQSSCPHSRPLLTSASAGETLTLKGRSGSVSCGGSLLLSQVLACTESCSALQASLVDMRFDSKHNCAPPIILLCLLLCHWTWGIFF